MTNTTTQPYPVETSSGKNAQSENFPVGSWLISPTLRPHVATFYDFARAADDIADNPALSDDERIRRLDGFAAALTATGPDDPDYAPAHALRQSLTETAVDTRYGLDLLSAFRQDVTKNRYESWNDLMGYCRRSAVPVGRYLIDLHGGCRDDYAASDCLCSALQVINHLQDCQDDLRKLDRVYLPMDWMDSAGASVEDLDAIQTGKALRKVFMRMIARTRSLLDRALPLPSVVESRRLAYESAVILNIARHLLDRLEHEDLLAKRVALSKTETMVCAAKAIIRQWI